MLVINWMTGRVHIQNIHLQALVDQVRVVALTLHQIDFKHVFHHHDVTTDLILSKEGLNLPSNSYVLEAFEEG